MNRTAPRPSTPGEILSRLEADLREADARLRWAQGQVKDLECERDALLRAIKRYTEEDTEDA